MWGSCSSIQCSYSQRGGASCQIQGIQHLIWEQITEDFIKGRCQQDLLLKDQSILLSSQFLTNHGTLVEGAIEYWPLVFRSLWFVAVNFHDAFFFFLCICRLEGSSLQVHNPYAKSYRIFPFLKFVCFRNMDYVYAKVNLKYIWMCQSLGPWMKPTFPPAGGLLTLLVILLDSSICLQYIWLEYYCQILCM